MSMKEINEIRSQIGDLRARITSAQSRLADACMKHNGVKIGDRIRVISPRGDFLADVSAWNTISSGSGRPVALRVSKNGKSGATSAGYIAEWVKV